VRSTRPGQPDTLYEYEVGSAGVPARTALDVNGNGVIDREGPDRVSLSLETYEEDAAGDWWQVSASASCPDTGSAVPVTNTLSRSRLTGLGVPASQLAAAGVLTAQSENVDANSATARVHTVTDAADATVWTVSETPGQTLPAVQKTVAGHLAMAVSSSSVTNRFIADGFGRQTAATDGRGNISVTLYDSAGQACLTAGYLGGLASVPQITAESALLTNRTAYARDALGRASAVTDASGWASRTAYDSAGNIIAQWEVSHPVAYGYDTANRKVSMRTFRGLNYVGAVPPETGGDLTQWLYDAATGLCTNKVYADGLGPAYAYLPDGRLSQRTWARGVETAYGYADTAAGRVQSADHSDGTPSVTNAYDLAGRLTRVEDGAGARTFAYDALGRLAAETNALAVITRRYDAQGMPSEFIVDNDAAITYAYDDLIRLTNVSLGGLTFGCAYLPQTRMQVSASNSCGSGWGRSYEGGRNLIAAVTNFHGSSLVASYAYGNDALGRRVTRNGDTFAYNTRSELTGATVGPTAYGYGYDGIGNLLFSAAGAATNTYAANALNQYASITGAESVSPAYDTDGNMLTNGVWAYAWDAENRLSAVDADGVPLVSNAYDYLGRRLREIYFSAEDSYSDRDIKILREKDSIRCINYYGNVHEFWSDYDQGKFRPPNLIKKEDGPSF